MVRNFKNEKYNFSSLFLQKIENLKTILNIYSDDSINLKQYKNYALYIINIINIKPKIIEIIHTKLSKKITKRLLKKRIRRMI